MTIEKILEREFSFTFKSKPKIKLKVLCSCGKKYIIKEQFPSWNGNYSAKTECPKCKDVSYIKHNFRYPDKGPEYTPEIATEKIA
jgi:hypothetical protein